MCRLLSIERAYHAPCELLNCNAFEVDEMHWHMLEHEFEYIILTELVFNGITTLISHSIELEKVHKNTEFANLYLQ